MPFGWGAAIGAGVSAVGSIASGLIGADASKSAANQQAEGQREALALQQKIFDTNQANIKPYQAYGENSLQHLSDLLGLNPGEDPRSANPILGMLGLGPNGTAGQIDPSTFQGSPGYQYAKQQGLDAVTNQMTKGPGGGNALLALQKTGQGLADQNWQQYLSNASTAWQQLLGNIGGGVGTGLSAVGTGAGIGQNFANAAGNNLASIGNAQSGGTLGSANALTGGINSALTSLNNYGSFNSARGGGGGGGYNPFATADTSLFSGEGFY